ncbi:hypothetical protein HY970_01720 [Candidatus Kaiserbacteria bacterium]|nr:hypothetical protein [Candidatus Kaiserbacteria bacterium]
MIAKRPLGPLSDFVANGGLAEALEPPADTHVYERIEILLESLSEAFVAHVVRSEHASVARLDVLMVERGLMHIGCKIPRKLEGLVELFSDEQLPSLTYEDLVMANPPDDVRAFTRGAIGETERMFYLRHALIEVQLAAMASAMRTAIENSDDEAATRALASVDGFAENVLNYSRKVGRQDVEHFKDHARGFRRFLMSHPTRGHKGPSGEFSPGIPIVDMLLHGDHLGIAQFDYIAERMEYYPIRTRESMESAREWVKRSKTLVTRWQRGSRAEQLWDRVESIGKFLNAFRALHLRVVPRQIPEVRSGPIGGTGGSVDVMQHLSARQSIMAFDSRKYR